MLVVAVVRFFDRITGLAGIDRMGSRVVVTMDAFLQILPDPVILSKALPWRGPRWTLLTSRSRPASRSCYMARGEVAIWQQRSRFSRPGRFGSASWGKA